MGHVGYIPAGRMGNSLFQMAAVIGYCKLHGLKYSMPTKTDNDKWNPLYFSAWLCDPKYDRTLPQIVLKEPHHHYAPIPFREKYRTMNVVLDGYWQSRKYWEHCEQEVFEAFRLPYKRLDGYCAIHIRRGDFLEYKNKHIIQSPAWLREAIYYFVDMGYKSFVVCSDGLQFAKETLNPLRVGGLEFSYSEEGDEIADLALLSCCDHIIGSSSTFAAWAYFLNRNPDKIGYFPKDWFVPGHGGLNTKDILPPEIIRV